MATADQMRALFAAHRDRDTERFCSIGLQIVAGEVNSGHHKLADDLKSIINATRQKTSSSSSEVYLDKKMACLLEMPSSSARLSDMILSESLRQKLDRVILEQQHADKILEQGLPTRRKLLLVGPPGTGKTMTASALAYELDVPLFHVKLDGLITKFMGETAAKLRQIFETLSNTVGVYLFDEFDAIGSSRGSSNDVGEIRRVLNSFLVMVEQDMSRSLILAATNHSSILDTALFRRFDDIINYEIPDSGEIESLFVWHLGDKSSRNMSWGEIARLVLGLSHADIVKICNETIKDSIIDSREEINKDDIMKSIDRVSFAYGHGSLK